MRRTHSHPRRGSRAYSALDSLHRAGGRADFRGWMKAASWSETIREFERSVTERLVCLKMVMLDAGVYALTQQALEHLGVAMDAPIGAAPVAAGPRTHFPEPNLSQHHMLRMTSIREGAHDYRDIPSVMGAGRVAYATKAKA